MVLMPTVQTDPFSESRTSSRVHGISVGFSNFLLHSPLWVLCHIPSKEPLPCQGRLFREYNATKPHLSNAHLVSAAFSLGKHSWAYSVCVRYTLFLAQPCCSELRKTVKKFPRHVYLHLVVSQTAHTHASPAPWRSIIAKQLLEVRRSPFHAIVSHVRLLGTLQLNRRESTKSIPCLG